VTARVAVRVAVAGLGLAGLVLVISEAGMQVNPDERTLLYTVFAASVLFAGAIGWVLTRLHRRLPSLRWTILVVAVAAVVVAGGVVAASAGAMFLAPDDLRVVLAALLLGTGLGVIVAISVTGPLTSDLRTLADAAQRVAGGDLAVRSGVDRGDEVGELATSLDRMVDQLAQLRDERERGESARRRLLAAIGHDLRTPLASLQAAVEAIQDGVAPDPDRYLRSMNGDVERLRSMVDDLFVLSRLEAGEQHLESIAIDLVELLRARAAFWGVLAIVVSLGGAADPTDETPLGPKRLALAALTFMLGALCFMMVPIEIATV
jgi:two-component system sensor histidine kinase BaeS